MYARDTPRKDRCRGTNELGADVVGAKKKGLSRATVTVLAAGMILALMPIARADTHVAPSVEYSDFATLLSDPVHGFEFLVSRNIVSGPYPRPDLEIFNAGGTSIETAETDWGGGIAIAGATLYVSGDDAIERFDLTQDPPAQGSPLTLTKMYRPFSIVSAGGLLWVAECLDDSAVETVDPSSGAEVMRNVAEVGRCPQFLDDPANANIFYAWDRYGSTLYRVNASSGSFVSTTSWVAPGGITDVAVAPGGGTVVAAIDAAHPAAGAVALDPTTLVPTGVTYTAGSNIMAVSVSPDGHVATADGNTVRVYPSGAGTPNAAWLTNGCEGGLVGERGLSFGPSGSNLFALARGGTSLFTLSNATSLLATSSLTLTPSSTAPAAGDTVTLDGNLSIGGSGASGRTVKLYEGGSVIDTATTSAGGAYSFAATPATAGYDCYEVRSAATGTATGAQRSVTLEVGQVVSILTMTGPATPPVVGGTVDLSGSLSFADAAPTGGKIVHLARSTDGAVFTPLGDVTVAGDGTWSAAEAAGSEGGYVFRATYDGTARYAPAEIKITVGVGRGASALSLRTFNHPVVYGHPVTLAAHVNLLPGTKHRTVVFTRQIDARKPEPVGKATVAPNGVAKLKILPAGTASYTASYAGDPKNLPSSDQVDIEVRVRIVTRMAGSYGKSGDYHVFHRGATPGYLAAVGPAGRTTLLFFLQRRVGGSWNTFARAGLHTKSNGVAGVAVNPAALKVSQSYRLFCRVRSGHVGREPVLGADSAYSYFRVTR